MRKYSKCMMAVLFAIIFMASQTAVIGAQTKEDEHVIVKQELSQSTVEANVIKGKVSITNKGTDSVKNVLIESVLPEGLRLKEGSTLKKEVPFIQPGDTVIQEFESVSNKQEETGGNETPSDGENKPGDESNTPATLQPEGSDDGEEDTNTPQTDDQREIIFYLASIITAGCIVIYIVKNKKVQFKKVLSILLCTTMALSMGGFSTIHANEENTKTVSMTVKDTIRVGEQEFEVQSNITYEVSQTIIRPTGNTVTRGQWITKLIDTVGYEGEIDEVQWDEEFSHLFDDIEGKDCEDAVKIAFINGIIDSNDTNFYPDSMATREFAAVTAVKALGFQPIQDIQCKDANDVTDKKNVETAVAFEILSLEQGYFYPTRELRESEQEQAIEAIKAVLASEDIDENYDSRIQFQEGVVELEEGTDVTVNGQTVTLKKTEQTVALEKDDIFLLPDKTPYKVKSIVMEEDTLKIETSEPTIEETVLEVDAKGKAQVDMSKFIPEEGIEIISEGAEQYKSERGIINPDIGIKLKVDKELIEGLTLKGELKFNLNEVEYECDISILRAKAKNVMLKLPVDVSVTGEIEAKREGNASKRADGFITLGKVPVAGIPGIGIYAEVGIVYSVSGKVQVVVGVDGNIGAQILNNRFRNLTRLSANVSLPKMEVEGKIGPEVKGLLEFCSRWDLIEFSVSGGVAASMSSEVHPNGLVCSDAVIYLFGQADFLKDCIIGDWLDLEVTLEFWNADTSPLKKRWHFENGILVPECTYKYGTFMGVVAEAGNRTNFITNATIKFYDKEQNNKLIETVQTDGTGKYKIKLPATTYKVVTSAPGYISFESSEVLEKSEEKYLETYLMVQEGEPEEQGIAGGTIRNAVSGEVVKGVTVKIRTGWNQISGEPVVTKVTDQNGYYQVSLPLGNYTVEMSKEGYITGKYNIVAIQGELLNQNATIVPDASFVPSGDLRIVLTWGKEPYDLDSHLFGPTADGNGNFHVYYRNRTYAENGVKYADLDVDDRYSYGPETTTIYNINSSGMYNFFIHDYTNRAYPESKNMSNSGAMVKVYRGESLIKEFSIPTNQEGVLWHVFDYDAETNTIIPVNEYKDSFELSNNRSANTQFRITDLEEKDK